MSVCENCGATIVCDPTFCASCGQSTPLLKNELSAKQTLLYAYRHYQWKKFKLLSSLLLVPFLAFLATFWFFSDFSYYLSLLLFLPIFLSPLSVEKAWHSKVLRFIPFSILFVCYLFALRLICQGDPILNLVYLIMCNYGLSISLPVIFRVSKGENLWEAIVWSINKIKESRWQQIFLLWILFMLNLVAAIPLGMGLFYTIPFTYQALVRYRKQLIEHYKEV